MTQIASEKFHISMFEEVKDNLTYETEFIKGVLDASLDGIFICEPVWNGEANIADLLIKRVNPAFTQIHKIDKRDAEGKNYLSLFPAAKDAGMFGLYCKVIETGIPAQKEFHYKEGGLNAWFRVSAVRLEKKQFDSNLS